MHEATVLFSPRGWALPESTRRLLADRRTQDCLRRLEEERRNTTRRAAEADAKKEESC